MSLPGRGNRRRTPRDSGWAGCVVACLLLLATALGAVPASAQDMQFFRIGTGRLGGTYFPIGGILASAISAPPGTPPCGEGGSCGVPGLIAVSQASSGSVENLANLRSGAIESALAQADTAYWAYTGTGLYDGEPPFSDLRLIAHLYSEIVHVVVPADSPVQAVADLAGRRVDLGEEGSGTLVDARLILDAYGVPEDGVTASYLSVEAASDAMLAGDIDAFFFTGGAPLSTIEDLARQMPVRLLPLDGPARDALLRDVPFFETATLEDGVYSGVGPVGTLAVGALWLTNAAANEELIHGIAAALWHPTTETLLAQGHPRGGEIRVDDAVRGAGVPLHPGAERWYRENGLLDGGAADDRDTGAEAPDGSEAGPDGGTGQDAPPPE